MPDIRLERKSIWVYVKQAGEEFANNSEFNLRYTLEDAVIEQDIGEYQGGGSGGGWMDISFEVENIQAVETAIHQLITLFNNLNVSLDKVALRISSALDEVCEDLPEFIEGDCLSYRFDDGDYGGLIVLQQGGEEAFSESTLVGLLDYKENNPPSEYVFDQRRWLIGTGNHAKDLPYLVWLHCYGGLDFTKVHHLTLSSNDPCVSKFSLS